ncbi:hypothetical protein FACS1894164_07050 [Spirochaetia bacterium]|nr:hypothetical protein FACS1894164_07050 [Spirochaetia bacterium]
MKKFTAIALSLSLFGAVPVFSQIDLSSITDKIDDFAGELAGTLPMTSTIGLNWSGAHVGLFGVGLSGGFTTLKSDTLGDLIGEFGVSGNRLPDWTGSLGTPLPAYAIDGRFGITKNLDIGVKFGWIPDSIKGLAGDNLNLDYLLAGAQVRLKILPIFHVGVGYNFLKGGIGTTLPVGTTFDVGNPATTITVKDPELSLNWSSHVIDAQAQVSIPIIIATPYAGLGVNYAWSNAGYNLKVSTDLSPTDKTTLENAGIDISDDKNFGKTSEVAPGLGFRVYGGISFNVTILKIDLTVMYNLGSDVNDLGNLFSDIGQKGSLGATLGIRVQL